MCIPFIGIISLRGVEVVICLPRLVVIEVLLGVPSSSSTLWIVKVKASESALLPRFPLGL